MESKKSKKVHPLSKFLGKWKSDIYAETGEFDGSYPDPSPYIREANSKERVKHKRLYSTYGITYLEWQEMLRNQGYVCWICKTMPKNGILCVDHEHIKKYKSLSPELKKKYVRGLLCFTCNTAFGRIERRKNPRVLLGRIVEYFQQFRIKGDPHDDKF